MSQAPAVVSYMTYLGLGLVRSLGREGVGVYALDPDPDALGMNSRYCKPVTTPDIRDSEDRYLEFMLSFGKKLGRRSVLFPTGDPTVVLFSKAREQLSQLYDFVMPDHDTVLQLLTKDGLSTAATACDVAAPGTVVPSTRSDVEAAAEALTFPVLLKPAFSHAWKSQAIVDVIGFGTKIVPCNTRQELLSAYDKIAAHDPQMIVQEIIPGPDSHLVYCCFYVGRDGTPLGMFQGRKCRVLPPGSGSASYVESMQDPKLVEATLQLLEGTKYRGLGGLEFKLDPRDGQYKLIEFNVRFGLWDALGAKCGVNLGYMAYRDALGLSVTPVLEHRTGVSWMSVERDLAAFRMYRRDGTMGIWQWLQSLGGEKMWAVWAWDDPAPFMKEAPHYAWSRVGPRFEKLKLARPVK